MLMVILFTVFSVASSAVGTYKDRLERYASVRAILRLIRDDVTSAFLLRDYSGFGSPRMGLSGEDDADPAFLNPAPDGGSDRLTLIRLRSDYDESDPKPGVVDVCYFRVNEFPDYPGRPNALLRVLDPEESGSLGTGSDWDPGDPLPLGFGTFPTQSDAGYGSFLDTNQDALMDCLVALNVSDLQFEYCNSSGSWTGDGDWDCDFAGLPLAVRVTVRLGPADSEDIADHHTFEDVIYLPAAD
jgi:hypothetical protein